MTCRLFTFGLYLDMPFVHFWGGLGMPLVHLAQQGYEFCRVLTFGDDLDTLLLHFWGWSSVFQCMVWGVDVLPARAAGTVGVSSSCALAG